MNINDVYYEIEIVRKNNKNTYIRVKDNKIIVTTNYFVSQNRINKMIQENKQIIYKMVLSNSKRKERQDKFYYLGNVYDIIKVNTLKIIDIDYQNNRIYTNTDIFLDKWLKSQIKIIFEERLKAKYSQFEEKIPYPSLRIRKMKTRWGVCSKKKIVTLNSDLIKYSLDEIDYVIVHELSHFIYFNHSKDFWNLVSKYCPKYKEYRKNLKN
ncbi:MAG: SprT family zinc-dependent metalloprotease [Bacilli bacterium]|nr:SprT family zinc-dependent metalloprotease [Bacilli bacterium]